MTAKISGIIFDLDGTLIDTEKAAAEVVEATFNQWGHVMSREDAAFVTGRTWNSAFDYLIQKYPLPASLTRESATLLVMDAYRASLQAHLPCVPGSADAVRALAKTFPLGLVSGSHRREILWALDQLKIRDCFQVVLGAEDYPRSKPATDGYAKALEMLSLRPEQTLIFEDSSAGIQSARDVGAWVVAITATNHFNQNIHLADHQIIDLQEVSADWVRDLSAKFVRAKLKPVSS